MDSRLDELLELLPDDLSPADRAQLLLRLEVLEEFSIAERREERTEEAIGRLRACRAFQKRLGWNPGRPAQTTVRDPEARRWARLERRLKERLQAPPALDPRTQAAAATWLEKVQGGTALSTPASRRYWREVCQHKIRMAKADSAFWHACLQIVRAGEGAETAAA